MKCQNTGAAFAAILSVSLFACGSSSSGSPDAPNTGSDGANPDASTGGPSFKIVTPNITVNAGREETHRYYTTYKGNTPVGVKRWASKMAAGSHHMIVYFMDTAQPDGVAEGSCQAFGGGGLSVWTYSSQTPEGEAKMPDGVGMLVKAGQPMCIEMHYLNATDAAITAHVELTGETYANGVQYQQAAAFVTYDNTISIPARSLGNAGGDCPVSASAKFFGLSTHVHKRGIKTQVMDGASMLFEATDWEHPGAKQWDAPFYQFSSGKLSYRCEYNNTDSNTVVDGNSAQSDEMCMAVGYFFPATKSLICVDSSPIN
jgi:hypothetical protein